MSKIIFFSTFFFDYHAIIHPRQEPPGRNFKKENKVSIFTFLKFFKYYFWQIMLKIVLRFRILETDLSRKN